MNDATSIAVRTPPEGIASRLAHFLQTWAARSRVPFRIVFANGAQFRAGDTEPAFTLHFRTARAGGRAGAVRPRRAARVVFQGRARRRRRLRPRVPRRDGCRLRRARASARAHPQSLARIAVLQSLARAGESQRGIPLRPPYDVLPPVARSGGDALHLRLLARGDQDPRGGAGQQDGPRLPQGRACGGRDLRRRRLRLRRPAFPRARQVRRPGHGHQRRDRNSSRTCAPKSTGAASATRSSSSSAISGRCRASTTSSCRSARWSTPAAMSSRKSCARTPRR